MAGDFPHQGEGMFYKSILSLRKFYKILFEKEKERGREREKENVFVPIQWLTP